MRPAARYSTRRRSVRLSAGTFDRLAERAAETSASPDALTERLLDEGLRIDRQPLIAFRTGGSGARRPCLAGTRLDVWQVVETVRGAGGDPAAAAVYLSVPERMVQAAVDYYADDTEEIDAYADAERAAAERERALAEAGRGLPG